MSARSRIFMLFIWLLSACGIIIIWTYLKWGTCIERLCRFPLMHPPFVYNNIYNNTSITRQENKTVSRTLSTNTTTAAYTHYLHAAAIASATFSWKIYSTPSSCPLLCSLHLAITRGVRHAYRTTERYKIIHHSSVHLNICIIIIFVFGAERRIASVLHAHPLHSTLPFKRTTSLKYSLFEFVAR